LLCAVSQVCLLLTILLGVIYVSLLVGFRNNIIISFSFLGGSEILADGGGNKTSPSAACGRADNDGHWYDFSPLPKFFYVYTAFLVDHKPQDEIRLISITREISVHSASVGPVLCGSFL